MIKKTNKKGFTLAELLIVVAIIAVLVAIAVPLFVGAIDKAEDKVKSANEATVKEMAISEILLADSTGAADSATKKIYDLTHEANGKLKTGSFYATAKVSAKGDVSELTIYDDTTKPEETTSKKDGDGWLIFVEFNPTDSAKAGEAKKG